jgi:hypothetical protein
MKYIIAPIQILILVFGLIFYWLTGRVFARSHKALIYAYCLTGGKSNDLISKIIGFNHKTIFKESELGLIQGDLDSMISELKSNGFLVFPGALDAKVCKKLLEFTSSHPAILRSMDGKEDPDENPTNNKHIYNGGNPKGVRYDYIPQDLLENSEVQKILADKSLLRIAEAYLESLPIADVLTMWWHTNFNSEPDSEAAQMYHFDMDRIKWLKIFIYLTDVNIDNGPHFFIRSSHRSNGIPKAFLKKGYSRLTDREVVEFYGAGSEVIFSAPAGTIIIEDTRGLHKGGVVEGNPRLILQVQFSNSLFGAQYEKFHLQPQVSTELAELIKLQPKIYKNYLAS